mmetsp:Transcript_3697/g.8020  ORF Transcript_3697/g.8020 Transcript_3697/m.8020 type:complete len:176 (+) Transcript_3697:317-844(+)
MVRFRSWRLGTATRPTPAGASTSPNACPSFCGVLGPWVPGRSKVGELGARRLLQGRPSQVGSYLQLLGPGSSTLCLEEAHGSLPVTFTLIQTVLPARSSPEQKQKHDGLMLSLLPEFFGSDTGSLQNGQRAIAASQSRTPQWGCAKFGVLSGSPSRKHSAAHSDQAALTKHVSQT